MNTERPGGSRPARGLTSPIAVLLLVALTVAFAGVGAVMLVTGPGAVDEPAPQVTAEASVDASGTVVVEHAGGDTVDTEALAIVVETERGRVRVTNLPLERPMLTEENVKRTGDLDVSMAPYDASPALTRPVVGAADVVAFELEPEQPIDGPVTVRLVHTEAGTVLAEHRVTPGGQTYDVPAPDEVFGTVTYAPERTVTETEATTNATRPGPNWTRRRQVGTERRRDGYDRTENVSSPGSGWERVERVGTTTRRVGYNYTENVSSPGSEWERVERVGTTTQRVGYNYTENATSPGSGWERLERVGNETVVDGYNYTRSADRPGPDWEKVERVDTRRRRDGYDYTESTDRPGPDWERVKKVGTKEVQDGHEETTATTRPGPNWTRDGVDHRESEFDGYTYRTSETRPGPAWQKHGVDHYDREYDTETTWARSDPGGNWEPTGESRTKTETEYEWSSWTRDGPLEYGNQHVDWKTRERTVTATHWSSTAPSNAPSGWEYTGNSDPNEEVEYKWAESDPGPAWTWTGDSNTEKTRKTKSVELGNSYSSSCSESLPGGWDLYDSRAEGDGIYVETTCYYEKYVYETEYQYEKTTYDYEYEYETSSTYTEYRYKLPEETTYTEKEYEKRTVESKTAVYEWRKATYVTKTFYNWKRPTYEEVAVYEWRKPAYEEVPVYRWKKPTYEEVPVYRWRKPAYEEVAVYRWKTPEYGEVPVYEWRKPTYEEVPVYRWSRERSRTVPDTLDRGGESDWTVARDVTATRDGELTVRTDSLATTPEAAVTVRAAGEDGEWTLSVHRDPDTGEAVVRAGGRELARTTGDSVTVDFGENVVRAGNRTHEATTALGNGVAERIGPYDLRVENGAAAAGRVSLETDGDTT